MPVICNLSISDCPPTTEAVNVGGSHVYKVDCGTMPFAPFTGDTVNGTPLHTTRDIALTSGVGFNVTITVKVAPTQAPDLGVTRYVTVWVVFVRLLNVPNTIVG